MACAPTMRKESYGRRDEERWENQVGMEHSSRRDPSRRVPETHGPERLPTSSADPYNTLTRQRHSARTTRITVDTALRLARFFDTTPQFWMNMQASYDLRKAENELGPKIGKIEPARK